MSSEEKKIEELVDRFFEGKTSHAQERELFDYFNKGEVASGLAQHAELFRYLGGDFIHQIGQVPPPRIVYSPRKTRNLKIGVSIAAAVALAFVAVGVLRTPQPEFNPYAGSYIVRNGQKIYDVELIRQEEQLIREMIQAKDQEIRSIYGASEQKTKELADIMAIRYVEE